MAATNNKRIHTTSNLPNEETRTALIEAQNDNNLTTVDMSSFDSFLESLELFG